MKQTLVIFAKDGLGARIEVNHEAHDEISKLPNVVVNPDVTHLKGVSPSHWKLIGGKIQPMAPGETPSPVDRNYLAPQTKKKDYMKLTRIVMVSFVACLIAYDIWTAATHGIPTTVSWTLLTASRDRPIIPFAIGILCGHFFWSQKHVE